MNSLRFYFRLATSNIKKNRRLYIPHILAGAGLVSVFFIMHTISVDPNLLKGKGGTSLPAIMEIGSTVTGLLSAVLLFYTNSFLMKQRKREFGLYNVLGMDKKDIGRVLFFENAVSSLISIVAGVLTGIIFYKLSVLLICNIFHMETIYGFYISIKAIITAVIFFTVVFLMIYVFNRLQIHFLKPVEMLQSVNMGEKEPKIKFLILLIGLAAMACGYYIALTTDSPLRALSNLFIAIILVIIGTYFLFIAGTIAVLKILKARKNYYYSPSHMTAVSGLLYRMKQNAVGLASICIMSTAVLVMLSTTVSLYAGIEESVNSHYQHDIYIHDIYIGWEDEKTGGDANEDTVLALRQNHIEAVKEAATQKGVLLRLDTRDYLELLMYCEDGNYKLSTVSGDDMSKEMNQFLVMDAQEYERITGRHLELTKNQIMYGEITGNGGKDLKNFSIDNMDFTCVGHIDEFPVRLNTYTVFQTYFMVVSNDDVINRLKQMINKDLLPAEVKHTLVIDYEDKLSGEEKAKFESYLEKKINAYSERLKEDSKEGEKEEGFVFSFKSKVEFYNDYIGMAGGYLFLGILLGLVFVFATAIIIYYKQISEGYEDRERFRIMQRVGMSRKEVKRTIRTQILLVFFLPLVMAVIHLAAAFRILNLLESLFFPPNNILFLICAIISVVVFGVVYGVIYSVTAKTYHRLVTQ